jgi:hypothetical protein
MQGNVYQIIEQRYGNQPHLYAVILEFSGNKDCIVVPAFSADGFTVNQVVQSRLDEGYRMDEIAVTIDNAAHVQFLGTHSGKPALWLVSDADRLPISFVEQKMYVGRMDEAGLKLIASGLLAFSANSHRFSTNVLKKLRQLVDR